MLISRILDDVQQKSIFNLAPGPADPPMPQACINVQYFIEGMELLIQNRVGTESPRL
jgi:hypothetical protein